MLCQNICAFVWLFRRFFVPLQGIWVKPKIIYVYQKPINNRRQNVTGHGPHGACSALLPLHPTAERLAETKGTSERWTSLSLPHHASSTNVPAEWGQHDLPAFRAPLKASFFSSGHHAVTRLRGFIFNFPISTQLREEGEKRERGRFKTSILFIYIIY